MPRTLEFLSIVTAARGTTGSAHHNPAHAAPHTAPASSQVPRRERGIRNIATVCLSRAKFEATERQPGRIGYAQTFEIRLL
jgi:hypothetical protein